MKLRLLSSVPAWALAIGSVSTLGSTTASQAADLPVYSEPPLFSWAGLYLGGTVGFTWGDEEDNQSGGFPTTQTTIVLFSAPGDADAFDVDGFIGGLHAGYNWQADQFVFGVEGDIAFSDLSGGADYDYIGSPGYLSLESDWQASARLRAGYAFDRTLLYVTGGVAFARAELEAASDSGIVESDSNTHVGWTIGGGIEHAFSDQWLGRIEARYTDFGSETYDLGTQGSAVKSSWDQTTVTVGLSYKF